MLYQAINNSWFSSSRVCSMGGWLDDENVPVKEGEDLALNFSLILVTSLREGAPDRKWCQHSGMLWKFHAIPPSQYLLLLKIPFMAYMNFLVTGTSPLGFWFQVGDKRFCISNSIPPHPHNWDQWYMCIDLWLTCSDIHGKSQYS